MPSYQLPENVNLAKNLDEDELKEIGRQCYSEYEADVDSRSEWRDMQDEWVKLFFLKDGPVNPPWEGASEESIPMLVEACNQFHARSYEALFPSHKIVSCQPTGTNVNEQIRERMDRVSAHMSYQLMVKDQTYVPDKDRLILACPLRGHMYTKAYFDPIAGRIKVDTIRPIDLVIPYGVGPRNIEDIPRKTERVWIPYHYASALAKVKDSAGYTWFIEEPTPCDYTMDSELIDYVQDEITGQTAPNDVKDYACVLEQHRFLDLDKDGIEEPYIVWIDAISKKVLRIAIRYETDEQGISTSFNKVPVEYYTDYPFITNPDGAYGLGYGILLGPINKAVNKLVRQVIDAGTLQNVGGSSGFIDSRVNIKGDILKMSLGQFKKVSSGSDDLRKAIFQLSFPGASNVTMEMLRALTLRGDRLAMVTETITGQAERVMQPTTVMALLEQAQIIFSASQGRLIRSWGRELQKIYRLNHKYMQEYEQFMYWQDQVQNGVQMLQQQVQGIWRKDYAPDMLVFPVADPKMTTKRERLAQSDAEFQTNLQNPFTVSSPAHLYNLYRRRNEAIGVKDVDAIMMPMPVDPLTGMPVVPQPAFGGTVQNNAMQQGNEENPNQTSQEEVNTGKQQEGEVT